jgi:outer membrane lipoprotein-sorting protein
MFKLCVVLLFFFTTLFAQDKAGVLLKAVQDKFETIEDLSANIRQSTGGKESLSGKIFYKEENKFYLELKNLNIVSNGSTVWNFNKKENKVIINEFDDSDPSALSLSEIINEYPEESNLTYQSANGKDILVVVPKPGSDLNFERAKLWISKDNLIEKISIERTSSGDIVVELSNYKLNQNLSDTKFTFIPPEGSTVIDLR